MVFFFFPKTIGSDVIAGSRLHKNTAMTGMQFASCMQGSGADR